MSCKFFTIIKTYFRCCITRDTCVDSNIGIGGGIGGGDSGRDYNSPFIHYNPNGEHSPFTFDDLTSISASSSTSSLNDYYKPPTLTPIPTSSFRRNEAHKRPTFHPFNGSDPYFSD